MASYTLLGISSIEKELLTKKYKLMSKKIKIPKPMKCYGFTGVWNTGQVGWMGLSHLGGSRNYPDNPNMEGQRKEILKGERLFMCEVIVKPLLDKKGRPITKIVR